MIYAPKKGFEKKLDEKLEELFGDVCIEYMLETELLGSLIIPPSSTVEIAKRVAGKMCQEHPTMNKDKSIVLMLLSDILTLGTGTEIDDLLDFLMVEHYKDIRVFHASEFRENPYFKNIKIPSASKGRFKFSFGHFEPYELMSYNVQRRLKDSMINISRIGCFDKRFSYPAILEKDRVWMSITPNEVCTMEEPIRKAKGKVLTLGCGMGYFAYMASLKEDVESVTIVEKEQDVIDLFSEYILPQFETKDKINIVKADAFKYLKTLEDGEFDYCFADIWDGVEDVESYLTVKRLAKRFKKTKFEYWIEEAILISLTATVYLEIMDTVGDVNRALLQLGEYSPSKRQHEYISNVLRRAEIKTPQDINYYTSPIGLREAIEASDVEF